MRRLAMVIMFSAMACGFSFAGTCGSKKADLVDTAVAAGSFETLVAAVQAAGLVDALKADGPLTVFAPTDEAFAKLAPGTVQHLLEPENRERLIEILTYHVAAGSLTADRVVALDRIETLNGQRPDVSVTDGRVRVGEAGVIKTDILASNGVIHVIDRVLIPSDKNIIETAVESGGFETLAAALDAADLIGALQADGPFTVFAPTDEAFANLPAGTVERLLQPENKEELQAILTYHVVPGAVYSSDVRPGRVETLEGSQLSLSVADGALMIDQARVVATDLATSNGVIHVIDEVILPESLRAAAAPAENLIRMAIERGVPLFNQNQPGACTAIYEVAAHGLLGSNGYGLSEHARETLRTAIARTQQSHDARQQAWIMRHALDDVMASLDESSRPAISAMSLR